MQLTYNYVQFHKRKFILDEFIISTSISVAVRMDIYIYIYIYVCICVPFLCLVPDPKSNVS
jgi:hypothetical protein